MCDTFTFALIRHCSSSIGEWVKSEHMWSFQFETISLYFQWDSSSVAACLCHLDKFSVPSEEILSSFWLGCFSNAETDRFFMQIAWMLLFQMPASGFYYSHAVPWTSFRQECLWYGHRWHQLRFFFTIPSLRCFVWYVKLKVRYYL